MLAILERLLKLEADDSGIPEAEFKLGYLLSFITAAPNIDALARVWFHHIRQGLDLLNMSLPPDLIKLAA